MVIQQPIFSLLHRYFSTGILLVIGEPGSAFENCIAHGNLLIIQEKEKEETDDSKWGGTISFKFDGPTYVKDTGVIDVDKNDRAQVFVSSGVGYHITETLRHLKNLTIFFL